GRGVVPGHEHDRVIGTSLRVGAVDPVLWWRVAGRGEEPGVFGVGDGVDVDVEVRYPDGFVAGTGEVHAATDVDHESAVCRVSCLAGPDEVDLDAVPVGDQGAAGQVGEACLGIGV